MGDGVGGTEKARQGGECSLVGNEKLQMPRTQVNQVEKQAAMRNTATGYDRTALMLETLE